MLSPRLAATFSVVSLLTTSLAGAAVLSASTASPSELYKVDSATGQATLVGPFVGLGKNEFSLPVIARAGGGALYGVASSQLQSNIYLIDESTANLTLAHAVQSGPVTAVGAAFDPTDGRLWFANTFGFVPWASLMRVDLGTGQEVSFGNIGPTPSDFYLGLAFDGAGNLYTLNATQNTLWRIDKTDPYLLSGPVGSGLGSGIALLQGGALAYDAASGQMIGYEALGGRFFSIDPVTGAATLTGAGPTVPMFSALAGGACAGSVLVYGQGCPGTGGFVPHLSLDGCPIAGQQVTLRLTQALAPTTAFLFVGLNQASLPAGGGCDLLVAPVLVSFGLPVGGSGPGAGSLSLPGILPVYAGGVAFTLQAWTVDPAGAIGGVASNGVKTTIAP